MSHHLMYIDPGSGSLLLQVIAGGVLAASMFVKTYWVKVKSIVRRKEKEEVDETV